MLAWSSEAVTWGVPGVALLLVLVGFGALHIGDRRFRRRYGEDR